MAPACPPLRPLPSPAAATTGGCRRSSLPPATRTPAAGPSREAVHGYEPDLILSIARGGLFLAGSLGYALDVKNLFVMNVEFYTGVDQRLDLPVVLPPTLDRVDLTGANVLVADDVADTGKTLELVRDFCSGYVAEVRTAVIYEKPQSVVSCDYGKDLPAPHHSHARGGTLPGGRSREGSPGH
jgi:hypothetical protein